MKFSALGSPARLGASLLASSPTCAALIATSKVGTKRSAKIIKTICEGFSLMLRRALTLLGSIAISMHAHAAFLSADNAVVVQGNTWSNHFGIDYTIDGSGLTNWNEAGLLNYDARTNFRYMQWAGSDATTLITYTFNQKVAEINSFYMWNAFHENISYFSERGVKDFVLSFYSDSILLGFNNFTASQNPSAGDIGAQNFGGFNYANVDRVDFLILNSYGGPELTMFHEIGFNSSSAVPIPAAGWLLGSALIGLVVLARRS